MLIKRFWVYSRLCVSQLCGWLLVMSVYPQQTFAAVTVEQFVRTISKTLNLAQGLIFRIAFACGMGFVIIGLLKFKAHRDNPAQIPLSTPFVLIAVGACLIFLPSFFELIGSAFFDNAAQPGLPFSKTFNL